MYNRHIMLMAAFFRWWYGKGWMLAWERLGERLQSVGRMFSMQLLVRTLFSPWRRVVAVPSRGLSGVLQAAVDNGVGRLIGFTVRCVVLLAAMVSIIALGVVGGLLLIIWPLMPPAVVALVVVGAIR